MTKRTLGRIVEVTGQLCLLVAQEGQEILEAGKVVVLSAVHGIQGCAAGGVALAFRRPKPDQVGLVDVAAFHDLSIRYNASIDLLLL